MNILQVNNIGYRIYLIAILIGFLSCKEHTQPHTNSIQNVEYKNSIGIDTSTVVILPLDSTNNWLIKNKTPATLSNKKLLEIDRLLNDCISKYNKAQEKKFRQFVAGQPEQIFQIKDWVIDLSNYQRQYIATLNDKGETEVWVNCFCRSNDQDWKKDLVIVADGGNCYFSLTINLTTKACFDLLVNGRA